MVANLTFTEVHGGVAVKLGSRRIGLLVPPAYVGATWEVRLGMADRSGPRPARKTVTLSRKKYRAYTESAARRIVTENLDKVLNMVTL